MHPYALHATFRVCTIIDGVEYPVAYAKSLGIVPTTPPRKETMWTILDACDQLKTNELGVFERAGRVYTKGQNNPGRDLSLYQEHGIIPKYVCDFLEYHERRRAIG